MPNRSSKRSRDPNQIAKGIVDHLTGEKPQEPKPAESEKSEKNPAAVALGRLGGLKGGRARAVMLSATKRKAIARKAAKARWQQDKKDDR